MTEVQGMSNIHWTARRKAELLALVDGGRMTLAEAEAEYSISAEELARWRELLARGGEKALQTTRVQAYRRNK